MTYKQALKLKVGDRVHWDGEGDQVGGSVIETGYNAVKVQWDNGPVTILHLRDMQDVSRIRMEPAA